MRVVLFAPPVPAAEVVAASLVHTLALRRINFGDLMRYHPSRRTELGIRAAEIMNAGEPFPDELAVVIVRDYLRTAGRSAFLFRGHPHSAAQARAFDHLLDELGTPLDGVLFLRLAEEEGERHILRQAARRICRNDVTHRFDPTVGGPAVDGVCPLCGGELYQRKDDRESAVRDRFARHAAMLEPIARHYAERHLLITVDASGTPDEASERALTALTARVNRRR